MKSILVAAVDAVMAEGFARLLVHTPQPSPPEPADEADSAAKD